MIDRCPLKIIFQEVAHFQNHPVKRKEKNGVGVGGRYFTVVEIFYCVKNKCSEVRWRGVGIL